MAGAGGVLGLAVAHWLARAIVALAPDDLPRVADIAVDATVALFTFAAVLVVALVTGAMPLRQAGGANLLVGARGRACDRRPRHAARRARRCSSMQIGLSVVLLVAAGLVLRSFIALRQVDLGFTPDRVLSLTVQPGDTEPAAQRVAAGFSRARPRAAGRRGRRRRLPAAADARADRPGRARAVSKASRKRARPPRRIPTLNHQIATPGYFEALKIPLRAGRLFTDRDTADVPRVAIVSESTARRLWPGQDPIGKRLSMATFTPGKPGTAWRTVVGVVSDVRYRGIEEVQLDVYDPALQVGRPADNIVVRAVGRSARARGLGACDRARARSGGDRRRGHDDGCRRRPRRGARGG